MAVVSATIALYAFVHHFAVTGRRVSVSNDAEPATADVGTNTGADLSIIRCPPKRPPPGLVCHICARPQLRFCRHCLKACCGMHLRMAGFCYMCVPYHPSDGIRSLEADTEADKVEDSSTSSEVFTAKCVVCAAEPSNSLLLVECDICDYLCCMIGCSVRWQITSTGQRRECCTTCYDIVESDSELDSDIERLD